MAEMCEICLRQGAWGDHITLQAAPGICSVASAGEEKPLNIMTYSNFEAMSNPDKFPLAKGTFSSERPKNYLQRIFQSETVGC